MAVVVVDGGKSIGAYNMVIGWGEDDSCMINKFTWSTYLTSNQ